MRKYLYKAINIFILIVLTIHIAVTVLFSNQYINYKLSKIHINPNNLGNATLTVELMRSNRSMTALQQELIELKTPYSNKALYTNNEIEHLLEVRKILNSLEITTAIFCMWCISYCISKYREGNWSKFLHFQQSNLIICMGITIILAVLITLAWNSSFIIFHKILFPDGNWSFPSDSNLIMLFPEKFWFDSAFYFSVIVLTLFLILYTIISIHTTRQSK